MKYRFLSVHKLIGVTRPTERDEEATIVEYPALKARVLLTYNINEHLFELDRASVVAQMMLKGLIGQGGEGTFEERLTYELSEFRDRREKEIGGGVFVVFEAEGEADSWNPKTQRELDDFVIAFEAVPKSQIRQKYETTVNGVLASFVLGWDSVCGINKVAEGVYFINEGGKPTYSFSFEVGTPTIIVSKKIQTDAIDHVKQIAKNMGGQPEVRDPAQLLVKSLDKQSDTLLAFLSIWTGLEIFVNKIFKIYETRMFPRSGSPNTPEIPPKVVNRIREVMRDKWSIDDKFSVVASFLLPGDSHSDSDQFKRIKRIRDKLVHGQNVPLKSLPIEETQNLLRKYLKLYTEKAGTNKPFNPTTSQSKV